MFGLSLIIAHSGHNSDLWNKREILPMEKEQQTITIMSCLTPSTGPGQALHGSWHRRIRTLLCIMRENRPPER